jgi:hypothetical protein
VAIVVGAWRQLARLDRIDLGPPLAYSTDVHVVVETASFIAGGRVARLTGGEIDRIIDHLAPRPDAGVVIQGTAGAREIRFAGRGKGKSDDHVLQRG